MRSFVNTRELDPDVEEISSPEALSAWLEAHGVESGGALDDADVERARGFRETIRSLLIERERGEVEGETVARLRRAAGSAQLRVEVAPDGSLTPTPAATGVDALIARVLAASASAQRTGEWDRLKVCLSDECLWAFYDRSRNRSRHWCSMDVCGNRAKTRAYRAKLS